MKVKMKLSKKGIILTLLALAVVVIIATGGSIAYFTDYGEAVNTFTMGKVKIDLKEPGWHDNDGKELLPGSVRTKDPTVTAMEGQSYMRVRMEIVDGNGNDITNARQRDLILKTLYYDAAYGTAAPNLSAGQKYAVADLTAMVAQGKIQQEYNKTNFTFAGIENGNPAVRYYNYTGIFDSGKTPPDKAVLFTNIVIPKDWNNEEIFILDGDQYTTTPEGGIEITVKGTGYKIRITAEAIQSVNMANADEAFLALDAATGVTRDRRDPDA